VFIEERILYIIMNKNNFVRGNPQFAWREF